MSDGATLDEDTLVIISGSGAAAPSPGRKAPNARGRQDEVAGGDVGTPGFRPVPLHDAHATAGQAFARPAEYIHCDAQVLANAYDADSEDEAFVAKLCLPLPLAMTASPRPMLTLAGLELAVEALEREAFVLSTRRDVTESASRVLAARGAAEAAVRCVLAQYAALRTRQDGRSAVPLARLAKAAVASGSAVAATLPSALGTVSPIPPGTPVLLRRTATAAVPVTHGSPLPLSPRTFASSSALRSGIGTRLNEPLLPRTRGLSVLAALASSLVIAGSPAAPQSVGAHGRLAARSPLPSSSASISLGLRQLEQVAMVAIDCSEEVRPPAGVRAAAAAAGGPSPRLSGRALRSDLQPSSLASSPTHAPASAAVRRKSHEHPGSPGPGAGEPLRIAAPHANRGRDTAKATAAAASDVLMPRHAVSPDSPPALEATVCGDVFDHWVRRRTAGGPLLRCFQALAPGCLPDTDLATVISAIGETELLPPLDAPTAAAGRKRKRGAALARSHSGGSSGRAAASTVATSDDGSSSDGEERSLAQRSIAVAAPGAAETVTGGAPPPHPRSISSRGRVRELETTVRSIGRLRRLRVALERARILADLVLKRERVKQVSLASLSWDIASSCARSPSLNVSPPQPQPNPTQSNPTHRQDRHRVIASFLESSPDMLHSPGAPAPRRTRSSNVLPPASAVDASSSAAGRGPSRGAALYGYASTSVAAAALRRGSPLFDSWVAVHGAHALRQSSSSAAGAASPAIASSPGWRVGTSGAAGEASPYGLSREPSSAQVPRSSSVLEGLRPPPVILGGSGSSSGNAAASAPDSSRLHATPTGGQSRPSVPASSSRDSSGQGHRVVLPTYPPSERPRALGAAPAPAPARASADPHNMASAQCALQ